MDVFRLPFTHSVPAEAQKQHYPPRLTWVQRAGALDDNSRAPFIGEGAVAIGAPRH